MTSHSCWKLCTFYNGNINETVLKYNRLLHAVPTKALWCNNDNYSHQKLCTFYIENTYETVLKVKCTTACQSTLLRQWQVIHVESCKLQGPGREMPITDPQSPFSQSSWLKAMVSVFLLENTNSHWFFHLPKVLWPLQFCL